MRRFEQSSLKLSANYNAAKFRIIDEYKHSGSTVDGIVLERERHQVSIQQSILELANLHISCISLLLYFSKSQITLDFTNNQIFLYTVVIMLGLFHCLLNPVLYPSPPLQNSYKKKQQQIVFTNVRLGFSSYFFSYFVSIL